MSIEVDRLPHFAAMILLCFLWIEIDVDMIAQYIAIQWH
jgi:hypothetical protein